MMVVIGQAVWGDIPPERQADMDSVREFAEARGWEYTCFRFDAVDRPRTESEDFRFRWLSEEPDRIWLDWDVRLELCFEYVNDGKVHLPFFPAVSTPWCKAQPDTFIAWGPPEWFAEMLELQHKRYPLRPEAQQRKLLRDVPGIIEIPPVWYRHEMYTQNQGVRGKCQPEQLEPISVSPSEEPSSKSESESAPEQSIASPSTTKPRKSRGTRKPKSE